MSSDVTGAYLGWKGERGYSAYEIAVQNGYSGTEEDWITSIVGTGVVSTDLESNNSDTTVPTSKAVYDMFQTYLQKIFYIGSTYTTQTASENPADILGFGTWERFKGKIGLGVDEDDEDLDTIGNTGGEKEHTLTEEEMYPHSHGAKELTGSFRGSSNITYNVTDPAFTSNSEGIVSATSSSGVVCSIDTDLNEYTIKSDKITIDASHEHDTVGGGEAMNNMQPYEVIGYVWIRRS